MCALHLYAQSTNIRYLFYESESSQANPDESRNLFVDLIREIYFSHREKQGHEGLKV